MKNESWKIIAIIFICLFILETLIFIYLWNEGTKAIENQNECAYNICDVGNTHEAYAYDEYLEICYCYKNGDIVHKEYMI